ncbi:EAL domain-containing protein [Synechocystis sp. LEGE 06083]|uniref:EAL domain-containing protein n=1 Tax=Synechocystis sp. LEGE 06083 TaxID=915336 RepID=UPI00187E72BF|nr:EAL domain-containing protein [Synechocystis sp. LEGE 06083]
MVITGLLGGTGIYVIYSMGRLLNLTHQLYHHPFAVNVTVEGIKADIFAMHRSMKDVVLADSSAELNQAVQQVDTLEANALDRFDIVRNGLHGDRQIIDQTEQTFINWKPIRDQVIALQRAGRTREAAAITKGQGANYVDRLVKQMDSVEEVAQNQAQISHNQAHHTYIQLLIVSVILLVSTVSLSVVWTLWLTHLIKQRRFSQNRLAFQSRRSEALLELPKHADQLSEVAFLQRGQEFAEELTGSKIAFIHFVNDDEQTIELVAWSRATLQHYCHAVVDSHYPVERAGIWADALRQRQPVVINDYAAHQGKKGLPEGHAHLERLISVSVIDNGKVVMLTGVGNKVTPYTDQDVETVQLISNEIWRITQSHRLYEQLKISERRYRQAQSISNMAHWELDLKSNNIYWSPEVFEILETNPADFHGSLDDYIAIVHPDDQKEVAQRYDDLLKKQIDFNSVHRIVTVGGKVKHVREYCEINYDNKGNGISSVCVIQDITEHTLTVEKLKESAAVFRNTSEGIIVTNLVPVILDVNQAFTEITGYSAIEVIGVNPKILQSGQQDSAFYKALWQTVKEKGSWRGELLNQRKDGSLYNEKLTIDTLYDSQNQPIGYVGIFSDISGQKKTEQQLTFLAHNDSLTGLANRFSLQQHLENAVLKAQAADGKLAVLFIDLDRFKQINDTFGHVMGDRLLQEVAKRLQQVVRGSDFTARISGDEFVLVLDRIDSLDQIDDVANQISQRIFSPSFILESQTIYITGSIGISLFPPDGITADILIRNADIAMYQAKQKGRNRHCFYDSAMASQASNALKIENALREAVKQPAFRVVYQPKYDLQQRRWRGTEALIRWQHPTLGNVPPAQFIPVAEQSDLILHIGGWVLNEACRQSKIWLDQGVDFDKIAVNVAGLQLLQPDFINVVKTVLQSVGFDPKHLELEVTEGFIMQHPSSQIKQLQQLQDMGISIAIDDFGTGYSSLSYLKRLPINTLKIDRAFVDGIPHDADDVAISRAILTLGKSMGLLIVAEGVETKAHAEFLRAEGCDIAQGYFYSRPIPPSELPDVFQSPSPDSAEERRQGKKEQLEGEGFVFSPSVIHPN